MKTALALWLSGISFGAFLTALLQEWGTRTKTGYAVMAISAIGVAVLVFWRRKDGT